MITPGQKFRKALSQEKPLQILGTINAYVALMAQHSGFQSIYLSGAGVANSSYGLPDLGLTTLDNVLEDVRRITEAVDLPLLVDRIKAAVDAKTDKNFVIMARTDALAIEGFDKTVDRALAYVEAGADMLFPEAFQDLGQYTKFKKAVKVPILANMTEFGQTPLFTIDELKSADVDMALYPLSANRAMNLAALRVMKEIKEKGTQYHLLENMQTREELYGFLRYYEYERLAKEK